MSSQLELEMQCLFEFGESLSSMHDCSYLRVSKIQIQTTISHANLSIDGTRNSLYGFGPGFDLNSLGCSVSQCLSCCCGRPVQRCRMQLELQLTISIWRDFSMDDNEMRD